MTGERSLPHPVLLPVAVISAAVLAYEVLLMRLFSIIQWHHFAYMIISIALLGFGASGTVLALAREALLRRFTAVFCASAALFALTAIGSFAVAERLPFNALAIVWDPRQLLWLAATYAVLVAPFLFGGGCIGLAFARYTGQIGRVYAFDLVGAGLGALGIVGVLLVVFPATALGLVGALGFAAAALAALVRPQETPQPSATGNITRSQDRLWGFLWAGNLAVLAVTAALWLPPSWVALHPHISQFKGLAVALRVPDAAIIAERSSPLALLSVVESPTIPFRHAPGLSLNTSVEPPPQLGVFSDADSISTITAFDGRLDALAYLDGTTAALPYHVAGAGPDGALAAQGRRVLILGAGGGEQVLLALYHRAAAIDAVEVNPQVVDLVRDDFAAFAGGIYQRPDVAVHVAEARSFVAGTRQRFDLLLIPPLDSYGAAAGGVQSLHESYTYTIEAMRQYLRVLEPGGILAITRWLKLPPRDSLKLFATAVAALEQEGVEQPGTRLAMVRSWKTTTLLVKNGPLTAAETAAVRSFAAARWFDVVYSPGLAATEANRFNILAQPSFYQGAAALLGPQRDDFIARYKFMIAPATDDRPYFFDFFRWRALPELLALRSQGSAALLDWGYLILFATLVQAAIMSLVLIMLPLWLRRRRFGGSLPRLRYALYFLALGLAFLFIEIAFIQKFILFLGNPIYAVAVVLAGFLVFAGLGSATAPWLRRALAARRFAALPLAVVVIAAVSGIYLFGLAGLFDRLMGLPDAAKIALSLVLIAPLAFFMGMPFPLGLAHVAARDQDLVPWAWGINGCASVLSAILATLLAMHAGFAVVVATAIALYLAAPMALREASAT